jgi:hypothetical protein
MASRAEHDRELVDALSGSQVNTVGEVISRMGELDALLADEDGLKWFNMLYLMVTEQIARDIAARRWSDGAWLAELDVMFARLYFDAILLWLRHPQQCPRAWTPLFESRFRPGVARVQFGMAGMNAHINRDLPVAVMRTGESRDVEPRVGTPQHDDYQRVNTILEQVEIAAMQRMATGIIGEMAHDLGRMDDVIAMWNVRKARDAAWVSGEILWAQRAFPLLGERYLAVLDRMAGFAGRGLLIPTEG